MLVNHCRSSWNRGVCAPQEAIMVSKWEWWFWFILGKSIMLGWIGTDLTIIVGETGLFISWFCYRRKRIKACKLICLPRLRWWEAIGESGRRTGRISHRKGYIQPVWWFGSYCVERRFLKSDSIVLIIISKILMMRMRGSWKSHEILPIMDWIKRHLHCPWIRVKNKHILLTHGMISINTMIKSTSATKSHVVLLKIANCCGHRVNIEHQHLPADRW